jgi:APA family basic amino acid/polyamine antiporter
MRNMNEQTVEGEGNGLKKTMGPAYLFTMAVATIIGPWLVMTNWWLSLTGPSIFLSFVIVGLMCIPIGLVYGELTAMLPQVGGSFYFIKKAFGNETSYWVSWCLILSYTAVLSFQLLAFTNIVRYLWLPGLSIQGTMLISAVLAVLCYVLNSRQLSISAITQLIMTVVLAVIGVGYVLLFFVSPQYNTANLSPFFATGLGGFVTATALMVTMFFGFEVIPQFAEESKYPVNKHWRLITVALIFSVGFYGLISIGEAGMGPLNQSINTPMLGAQLALQAYGPWLQYTIAIGNIAALIGCLIGFWLAGSRLMLSMGREGILPKSFAKLNKNHVPSTTNFVILLIVLMFILLSGTSWISSLFSLMALGVGLAYTSVSISWFQYRRKFAHLDRPWKVPGGKFTAGLAVIDGALITFFTIEYFTMDIWTLAAIYFAIGVVIRVLLFYFKPFAKADNLKNINQIKSNGNN